MIGLSKCVHSCTSYLLRTSLFPEDSFRAMWAITTPDQWYKFPGPERHRQRSAGFRSIDLESSSANCSNHALPGSSSCPFIYRSRMRAIRRRACPSHFIVLTHTSERLCCLSFLGPAYQEKPFSIKQHIGVLSRPCQQSSLRGGLPYPSHPAQSLHHRQDPIISVEKSWGRQLPP